MHKYKKGCGKCGNDERYLSSRYTLEEFIEKSKFVHGEDRYDYSSVEYNTCIDKVKILCNKHNEYFYVTPHAHLNSKCGCPICNYSKGESFIQLFLTRNNIKFEPQYKITECRNVKPLPFDFGILNDDGSLKFLCEFQGRQHFECVKYGGPWEDAQKNFQETIFRDAIKKEYCEKNQIPILYISYKDLDKVEEILSEYLKLNFN